MQHCSTTSNQDVRMAVHGDDLVCLSDEDGLDAVLKAQYTAKVMGTFGLEDSVAKTSPCSTRIRLCSTDACSTVSCGETQICADKIKVFVASDVVGDPVSGQSTTGLVAPTGKHTVRSGSTLESLTALSVGVAEFYAVVKGGQVGLSLRSIDMDLGIQMKVEIQIDSSTANSLTDQW